MNYIKVTQGEKSFVVLAANKAFYKKQGYSISEPTKQEIEAHFPTPKNKKQSRADLSDTLEYESLRASLTTVSADLANEKSEHEKTKSELETVKSELTTVSADLANAQTELEKAKKEIEKLKK